MIHLIRFQFRENRGDFIDFIAIVSHVQATQKSTPQFFRLIFMYMRISVICISSIFCPLVLHFRCETPHLMQTNGNAENRMVLEWRQKVEL